MSAPWENPPVTWEAAAVDDHGNPAWFGQCDGCDRWAWLLNDYSEASGPCELDPDYAKRLRQALADPHSGIVPGGAAMHGHAGPLCGNCAAVIAFCSACLPVLFRPGGRGTWEPPEDWPPRTTDKPGAPPWAVEGGEVR